MKAWDGMCAVFGRRGGRRALAAVVVALMVVALPPVAAADTLPTVSGEAPAQVNIVTARLTGAVNPNGSGGDGNTTWRLQWSPAGQEAWSTANEGTIEAPASEEADPVPVEAFLGFSGELKAGHEYEFRIQAENGAGQTETAAPYPTFTMDPVVAPVLTAPAVTDVTATSAHLEATVNPEGGNEDAILGVLPIRAELQLSRNAGASWETVATEELSGTVAEESTPVTVAADPTLVPNSNYEARLLVHYAGLEAESPGPNPTFSTAAIKPDVEDAVLWEPKQTSIQLNAYVNAHNDALTECHFVWGPAGTLNHSVPCESPHEGEAFVNPSEEERAQVSARITGLAPATEYTFRLIAANPAGVTTGEVRRFTSLDGELPRVCPNATIRQEQHSGQLADCRAWEMVSPEDKNNGDIVADARHLSTIAARGGNAVIYSARANFGDTTGSGMVGQTQYLSRRSPEGWKTHAVTPLTNPAASQSGAAGGTEFSAYSTDLSRALLFALDLPGATNDAADRRNLYVEDTATRAVQTVTVTQDQPLGKVDFLNPLLWGASDDVQHVAFMTETTPMLPDAIPFAPNLYQWDEGKLSLAGRLPDGTVPPEGSRAPFEADQAGGYRRTMSADGSRLLFMAAPVSGGWPQLYQRINGARTVWISEPEGSDSSEPVNVSLMAATPDGRTVLFTTDSALLDSDTNPGPDLYRWTDGPHPANERNLTLITHTGDMPSSTMGAYADISDDGELIYFHTQTANMEVWSHGSLRRITEDIGNPSSNNTGFDGYGATSSKPGASRVTPDGMYFAYVWENEMYLYSAANDSLACISCSAAAGSFGASPMPIVTDGTSTYMNIAMRPTYLANDGRVFFTSPKALVPEDTNGVRDAYEYDPKTGSVSLLSSGKGRDPSGFMEAGADGDDVFIATRQPLVSSDRDQLVDVYDARVDGGFDQPTSGPSPCEGESCQPMTSAPTPPSVASEAASRGNLTHPRHRCSRHKGRPRQCAGQRKKKTHKKKPGAKGVNSGGKHRRGHR